MSTTKLLVIINRFIFIILMPFITACAVPGSRISNLPVQSLYQKGVIAFQHGNFQKAQRNWRQGLKAANQNKKMIAWNVRFLIGLARVSESLGDYKNAIDLADQALQVAIAQSNKTLEADAHTITGQAYRGMGNYPKAKFHSEQAQHIAHLIGNLQLESDSTRNLGAIHKNQGRLMLAENLYQDALELARQAEDDLLQAKALNNLGELSHRRGQYSDALGLYKQSLQLRQKIDDRAGQGNVLGNMCRVYQDLNDHELALSYCKRALKIARKIHAQAYEANHLNNIAEIYWRQGKFDEAKAYFYQSIKIKKALDDRDGEARALNNLAVIFKTEGKNEKALEYYLRSLEIKKHLEDRSGLSATYYNIGWTYSGLGQYEQAVEYLKQALLIQAELAEAGLFWRILDKLSDVHQQLAHPDLAIFYGKLAVNSIQSLRSMNLRLEKYLQKSYLEDKRTVYERLANLLIDQGRFKEAQQILGMLKEEEYFEFIQRQSSNDEDWTQATYTKTESDYETRYRNLTAHLMAQREAYIQINQKLEAGEVLTQQENQRLDALNSQLEKARLAYLDFLSELEQVFTQESHLKEFYDRDLDEISHTQHILSKFESTVLIYYLYTDEKLRIILIDSNLTSPPVLYEKYISRSELNQLIYSFREKLSGREDTSVIAKRLFELLIKPIQADLNLLDPKTLLIYPARSLRYLPFSALYDGQQYLIEKYAVAMYNAAAQSYLLLEKPKPQWSVAGFGVSRSLDPEFTDLPAVEFEIDAIVKESIAGESEQRDKIGILPGNVYMNLAFTADQLMKALKKKDAYQVIHLATHFKFTPGSQIDSFLLAGRGEHISLLNLLKQDYQMAGKDLVTLSACETALGELDELNNDGRELEGLGTLIQRKGAYAVLATLWSVADQSTAVFMEQFYALREKKTISKAEAIRQTQLMFIEGKVILDRASGRVGIRGASLSHEEITDPQFAHPYFWAPFILMGNWQ